MWKAKDAQSDAEPFSCLLFGRKNARSIPCVSSIKRELSTEVFNAYVQQAVSAKSRQEFLAGVHSGEYNQAMNIYDAVHISIKDMIKCAGYTQAGFAKEYMIPIRTVEDWCSCKNTPTTYLKLLLAEKLGILNIKRTEVAK